LDDIFDDLTTFLGKVRVTNVPGLVNIQKTMERSTIFNGKINYFDWAMASIAMLVYQRVVFH
jgi:hypothetical protein